MYIALKHLHMLFALLSGAMFLLRGVWMLLDSALLHKRWVRIVPHVNDALLLTAALVLMVTVQQYPGVHHWLTAKVIALFVYIGLGMLALKPGRPKLVRAGALAAALLVYGYILGVAFSRDPAFFWPV
jgi:uncharacterized membrane protein SirB2